MELDYRLTLGLGLPRSIIENVHDIAKTPGRRLHVAKLLGEIDVSYWGGIGSLLVDDPSSRVRGEVALSLGATGDEEAIHLLNELASDGVWQVRSKVALAALKHGSEAVLPIVIKLLLDDDPRVRAAALRAYIRLRTLHPEVASNLQNLDLLPETKSTGIERVRRILAGGEVSPRVSIKLSAFPAWECEEMLLDFSSSPDVRVEFATLKSEFDIISNLLWEESGGQPQPEAPGDELPEGDEPPKRYVNSWFVGHPDPLEPLRFGQKYELGIQVSPKLRVGSFTKGEPDFHEPEFGAQDTLDVIVAIVTDDFEVLDKPAKRMKLSKDKTKTSPTVTFKVRPIKNNQDVFITVLFYHENNLFHEACIGARVQVLEAHEGMVPTAYFPTENRLSRVPIRGPRNVNLQVIELKEGYRLILFYDFGDDQFDVMWCKIPITRDRVADLLQGVRDDIVSVVHTEGTLANGEPGEIFFDGEPPTVPLSEARLPKLYAVDDTVYKSTLESLARAGRKLYVNLFHPTKGTQKERAQARQVGKVLRQLSAGRALKIQVLSDDFFIPWSLLYDGDYPAEEVNPDEFWGFKHVIEEVPYRTHEEESEAVISVGEAPLRLGMNINRTKIQEVLIKPQLTRVQKLKHVVQVYPRFTEKDVLDALRGEGGQHQLEYFYCHAGTAGDPQKDFDQSYLGLTKDDTGLTLEDIKLATVDSRFQGNPLFILNACESAQMDGRFYDGFVPKFLNMGACAVVGTDCEVPSLFGAHFGMVLLEAFFRGSSIGEALLAVRKQFLAQYQNPLGLIYRIFGNTDVCLYRPII